MRVLALKPFDNPARPAKIDDCVEGLRVSGQRVKVFNLEEGPESLPGGVFEKDRLKTLLEEILTFRPDLILTSEHRGVVTELFNRLKIPYASWFTVTPIYWLKREWVSPYCIIFTWDKGYIDLFRELGFGRVFYLPLATNPRVFRSIGLGEDEEKAFGCNISFAGSSGYSSYYLPALRQKEEIQDQRILHLIDEAVKRRCEDPQCGLNRILNSSGVNDPETFERLVGFLATPLYRKGVIEKVYDLGFRLYGDGGWEGLLDKKVRFGGFISNRNDLPRLYNTSKINLNMTDSTTKMGLNARVFDISACGGFMLTDYREDLKELFNIDEEIVYFRNREDLRAKIRYFLDHPDEREEIARRAKERVLAYHTYERRMSELVDVVEEIFGV